MLNKLKVSFGNKTRKFVISCNRDNRFETSEGYVIVWDGPNYRMKFIDPSTGAFVNP